MMSKGLFIVVSAPSGTGKSSICDGLMKACPEITFLFLIPPGRHVRMKKTAKLFFISKKEFQKRLYRANLSNGLKTMVIFMVLQRKWWKNFFKREKIYYLILNRVVQKIERKDKRGYLCFYSAPSKEELLRRLRNRGCETEDIIQQRFKQAENEIKEIMV